MKMNFGDNYLAEEGLASDTLSATDFEGASVDHAKGPSSSFIINVGTFATSLVAKLQYSDNDSDWTDEPTPSAAVGYPGNDVSVTFSAAGQKQINCPNPRGRYTRVLLTSGGANEACVINVVGPLRSVGPDATS
jgi:hypothetical protein